MSLVDTLRRVGAVTLSLSMLTLAVVKAQGCHKPEQQPDPPTVTAPTPAAHTTTPPPARTTGAPTPSTRGADMSAPDAGRADMAADTDPAILPATKSGAFIKPSRRMLPATKSGRFIPAEDRAVLPATKSGGFLVPQQQQAPNARPLTEAERRKRREDLANKLKAMREDLEQKQQDAQQPKQTP